MSLIKIQSGLKAPKNQTNKFGGYKYRSAEDIMEAVKPLLNAYGYYLIVSDEIVQVGERIYVKATATLKNDEGVVYQSQAFAREEETKKGMDSSQITGAASSYARKYALSGLFCIDDTKDADATNDYKEDKKLPELKRGTEAWDKVLAYMRKKDSKIETVRLKYLVSEEVEETLMQDVFAQ